MLRKLAVRRGDESGFALVLVIGVSSALTILLVAGVALALGSQRKARTDQDWSSAMAAAYAGVEEYQSRLANDTAYVRFGNPAAQFSSASTNLTLPTGLASNPAFGIGKTGTWAEVAGSGGSAHFRYEVDSSTYSTAGQLRLRATGRAGGETRTIVADLKQQGFIDFLYFTDYEIQDPSISGKATSCVKHYWEGRTGTSCGEIQFGGSDVVDGPVHSNDTLRICDATFKGIVSTAYNPTTGLKYLAQGSTGTSCTGAVFENGKPVYSPSIPMPPTNSELRREVRNDLAAEVPRPGCLYTGPTSIKLNSDGTMTVRSPWTKKTVVSGSPATAGAISSQCGTPGTGSNQLGSATGAKITVPDHNVVYIQNVPSLSSDPNFATTAATTCKGASGAAGNGIGYPVANEVVPTASAYGCNVGDAFVEGTLDGQLTIATENHIYITGDIKYKSAADDMLGLVANNVVWVWNPVKSDKSNLLSDSGRRIDAAILSVAHTFQVQNYDQGVSRGTLTINGAISQKFRGTVGLISGTAISSGYKKAYKYDTRFRYTAPPKFLSPVTTTYGVSTWIEVDTAFDPDGSYR
ncbi:hypothetical protein SAMN05216410_1399 [Sanguibacter gelidistatuariae]|uniref:Uncharacterized protein n=1 Tax=Sanguibacter gelidistatuariae TaxID=1814289 RepID=A0A1G6JRX3_9MICO|nr:hypothetical protein [Sanguibacter gelidistatuariae]SDC21408.1 hypothetical protein SAMN05216410_1399 [Sanguibacter gelidistatuariae]